MKVLITGGAGYIGSELLYRLSQQADIDQIVIYDNLYRSNYNLFISGKKFTNSKIRFVLADLLDSRKLRRELAGIDVVYHLAAKVDTPFSDTDSHIFEQINHWGTAELVYAIEESKHVSKVIYVSSASVYGSSKDIVSEATVPNPKTFYGVSKMRGEEHVRRLSNKISTLIIRTGNVYGYSQSIRFDSVVNKFMFDANFNNRISIHGSGKQSRSFINISKVADALSAVRLVSVPSGTYNLTDKNMEILDLVDVMKEIFPDLEFIFINQHLDLRELKVEREGKLMGYINMPNTDFKQELIEFKDHFSFRPEAAIAATH